MTPRIIQDSDNLVRYLGEMMFRTGELDGAAFSLRPGEEGLSVNLLDAAGGLTKAEQVAEVQRSIHLRVGRNSRFAELNAGQIRERLAGEFEQTISRAPPPEATRRSPGRYFLLTDLAPASRFVRGIASTMST